MPGAWGLQLAVENVTSPARLWRLASGSAHPGRRIGSHSSDACPGGPAGTASRPRPCASRARSSGSPSVVYVLMSAWCSPAQSSSKKFARDRSLMAAHGGSSIIIKSTTDREASRCVSAPERRHDPSRSSADGNSYRIGIRRLKKPVATMVQNAVQYDAAPSESPLHPGAIKISSPDQNERHHVEILDSCAGRRGGDRGPRDL